MIKIGSSSILINYVGYPHIISALQPDNGLASLAGQLVKHGHKTLILDYATADIIKRLFPAQYQQRIDTLLSALESQRQNNRPLSKELLDELKELEKKTYIYIDEQTKKIAEEIDRVIKEEQPDFIAFKLFLGQSFQGSIIIADILREKNPSLKIFGGGPQVDGFMEEIFKKTQAFDALAYGEGEETILHLADYSIGKRALSSIPNLIYIEDGKVVTAPLKRVEDLNGLAWPLYDEKVYPAMKGSQKMKAFLIEENRGCPYCCNFCFHPLKSGTVWRKRDAKNVVDMIEDTIKKHGTNIFRFVASSPSQQLRLQIADEIIKRKLDIKWVGFERVSDQPLEFYRKMKDSGCVALFFGVESGSQKILDESLGKKTKVNQIKKTIALCKEAGIYSCVGIIFPCPNETKETAKETEELILEIRPDSVVISSPFMQMRTDWYNNMAKYGFKLKHPETFALDTMYFRPKFTFPPYLWDPYPHTLNGKDSDQLNKETDILAANLANNGITMGVIDDSALLAVHLDMDMDKFGKASRRMIQTGDHASILQLNERINHQI
ncbi:MAG TPA: radical SAM protein [Candidatus Nanoarchaeia archaeon]|nr:radical SAM protein [Candidatus Nanoarchaeia archaeon]